MSIYDTRLDALETDAAMMKRDIVYKLDDTNSTVTILRGVMGVHGRDLRFLINQVKGLDIRLEGVEQDVRAIKEQQDLQGHAIRELQHSIVTIEGRLGTMEGRLDAVEGRLDTIEGRLDAMEGRLDAMEKSFNARFDTLERKFDQILQLLMPPSATDK
jgi:septal ring factor EnvC (AmiA/AmiB activator)